MSGIEFDDRVGVVLPQFAGGMLLANPAWVRIEDLINWKPGNIVSVQDVNEAVRWVPFDTPFTAYEYLAGLISEDV